MLSLSLSQAPGNIEGTHHAEPERDIRHAVHHAALVLGAVLGPAADVRLDDCCASLSAVPPFSFHLEGERLTVRPVQERLGAVLLDPDLVAGAGGDDGQGGDVQAELARLGHLADAGAQAQQGVAADAGGEVGDGELDEVDARVVQAEDVAVAVFEGGDQALEVGHVVGELGVLAFCVCSAVLSFCRRRGSAKTQREPMYLVQHRLHFFVCQRAHLGGRDNTMVGIDRESGVFGVVC